MYCVILPARTFTNRCCFHDNRAFHQHRGNRIRGTRYYSIQVQGTLVDQGEEVLQEEVGRNCQTRRPPCSLQGIPGRKGSSEVHRTQVQRGMLGVHREHLAC